jgi:hypothetical protein
MTRVAFARLIPVGALLLTALLLTRCGGGSSSKPNSIASAASNVQAIAVNSGPANNYPNGVFTSVTVCVPSSSNCQTISGILVDTGSYGLRLLSSAGGGALTLSLPQQTSTNGNIVGECTPFVSGFTWGPVETADIQISGEQASSLPVQVIDPTFAAVPAECQSFGVPEQDTMQTLGTNGILGIGPYLQDCGNNCTLTGNQNPGLYYACASTSCQVTSEPLTQQVQNPVGLFATDNNGVIVELPAVTAPEVSINGSLVFGIGTESNNALGSASVFPLNTNQEFTVTYNGQPYPGYIDSGSNGLFFLDTAETSLPQCGDFYCPTAPENLSATNSSTGGATETVNFTVDDANTLFGDTSDFVFPTLAGPSPGVFDWGLPFFFGRNVFNAIESRSTPAGQGPYWAY